MSSSLSPATRIAEQLNVRGRVHQVQAIFPRPRGAAFGRSLSVNVRPPVHAVASADGYGADWARAESFTGGTRTRSSRVSHQAFARAHQASWVGSTSGPSRSRHRPRS